MTTTLLIIVFAIIVLILFTSYMMYKQKHGRIINLPIPKQSRTDIPKQRVGVTNQSKREAMLANHCANFGHIPQQNGNTPNTPNRIELEYR
jgi:hypothetical protein